MKADHLATAYGIPTRRTCQCVNHYCSHHQAIRAMWAPLVRAGDVECWRCEVGIPPDARWDLGHDDEDKRSYRGPEHRRCNRATASRRTEEEANRWTL